MTSSPKSPFKRQYGDRFIPSRAGNSWHLFPVSPTSADAGSGSSSSSTPTKSKSARRSPNQGSLVYSSLLKNEILGCQYENKRDLSPPEDKEKTSSSVCRRKLFHFEPTERPEEALNEVWTPYSLSPVSKASHKLLSSAASPTRRISKRPCQVLDAPGLKDDYYLNVVDWSAQNMISVALDSTVYMWSAVTSKVSKLYDLAEMEDFPTSLASNDRGNLLAIGTDRGLVQIWDTTMMKLMSTLNDHTCRVAALAWNGDLLCSGSRDRKINQKDIRTRPMVPDRQLVGHKGEVCGMKWSPDNQQLASGGNDNCVRIWNLHSTTPVQTYFDHVAAVKAIAWSPHRHGLLATGGGTADRCIRIQNTLSAQSMYFVDTDSQVCNLAWSKHSDEIVSTHGYSNNEILVWKYPSFDKVARLNGHARRVLYMAMSPNGHTVVTGAGDETLRLWNMFGGGGRKPLKRTSSVLDMDNSIR